MNNRRKKQKLQDEELLHLFLNINDMVALGELYHRYIPLVYGLSLKYLMDQNSAQDAVMDIFELVASKLPQYKVKNFKTWLYSVAKNHCLQILKKEKKMLFVELEENVMENEHFYALIEKPQTQREMEALTHCLSTLPEMQQKSIHYFFLEEKSYADIVEITGFTLNNVKSYIQNGKRNLKNCLVTILQITSEA